MDSEGRIGLFVGNNPVNNFDPDGLTWQWWHNLWHTHGGDPTPDPNSNLALRQAEGVGITQLTDANGNRVQPGNIVPNALGQAAANIAMLPLGGPEEEGAYAAADEALKALDAAKAAKCEKLPKLITNPKHHPNSMSPQPKNVEELFKKSISDENGVRWAKDDDGAFHRFSKPSNGESHWNGST
ncbi:MAG: hypothetical protein ACRD5L_10040, partial [Bryobacteraceae bacterium]